MKNIKTTLILTLLLTSSSIFSQTKLKEYQAGKVFSVSIPDYLTNTVGYNDFATFQYENLDKGISGYAIIETKEEIELSEKEYGTSIGDFYNAYAKELLPDAEARSFSKTQFKTIGEIKFAEGDFSYFDGELKEDMFCLVGVVETKSSFYIVYSWCLAKDKTKYKSDFQKILYSIKD
jgi:hypothetical protein